MSLKEIEELTKAYADTHEALAGNVRYLEDEIAALKRAHLREIKRLVKLAAERKSELKAAIESDPELWRKPRTHVFHGIEVGLRKMKGRLEWADAGQVVERIKRLFAKTAGNYLVVTEKPDAKALATLPAADLKRLGVEVTADSDGVVIKSTTGEVEKVVAALLSDAVDEAQKEAA